MNPLGLRARDGMSHEDTRRSRSFAASGSAPLAERALLLALDYRLARAAMALGGHLRASRPQDKRGRARGIGRKGS